MRPSFTGFGPSLHKYNGGLYVYMLSCVLCIGLRCFTQALYSCVCSGVIHYMIKCCTFVYRYCFFQHRQSHGRISIAGYHPGTSLLLFPACCPGDQRHVAAGGCRGGCWCLPASHWSLRSAHHTLTSNKGFVHRRSHLSLLIVTQSSFLYNMSSFPSLYLLAFLTLLFSPPHSLPLLSVFSMIMLLSRSLLSECSLVELIFG